MLIGKFILTPDEHNTIGAGYSYSLQERTATAGKSATTDSYTKIERTNYLDHQLKYDKFTINSYITRDKDRVSHKTMNLKQLVEIFKVHTSLITTL